ncbi:MAG: hypothetical protein P8K78_07180 [Pirellulales bacterium]|nr:hypothetical protein [Pirellulales bacterium]
MTKEFDPYHKWLGIAPEERVPTHYRLLGLNLFESDPEVIEAAADRQMTYLQGVSEGAEFEQAQKLLTEVAKARVCLLNVEQKAAYDTRLRSQIDSRQAEQPSGAGQSQSASQRGASQGQTKNTANRRQPRKDAHRASTGGKRKTANRRQSGPSEEPSKLPPPARRAGGRVLLYGGCVMVALIGIVAIGYWAMSGSETSDDRKPQPLAKEDSVPERLAASAPAEQSTTGGTRDRPVDRNEGTPPPPLPERKPEPVTEPDPAVGENPAATDATAPANAGDDEVADEVTVDKEVVDEKELVESEEAETGEESPDPPNGSAESPGGTPVSKPLRPIGFVELQIGRTDLKTKFIYEKQPDHFYTAEGSTSAFYRIEATGGTDSLSGLCLEVAAPAHQTATLTNLEVKSVTLRDAVNSLGGDGAATAIDVNENAGWQLQFSGEEPVWAVFSAERPFGPSVLIEMKHSSNAQRLPRFRLWGITGDGTAEEMAEAMRNRRRAEKPFADFVARGLPVGRSGEVSLGSVFVGSEKLVAQLFGGNGDSDVRFALKRVGPNANGDEFWQFVLSSTGGQSPVAELKLHEGKLTLGWLPAAAQMTESAALRNGLLQLRIGQHIRNAPLREVTELVPLSYDPLKPVRPQIEVPPGIPPEDLRLVLQLPKGTFGVEKRIVLTVAGSVDEQEIPLNEGIVLNVGSSWKPPVITLSLKTFFQTEVQGKDGKAKPKTLMLRKAFSDISKQDQEIEKLDALLDLLKRVEKYADRSRLKPAERQEMLLITKQWRAMGFRRGAVTAAQAEKMASVVEVRRSEIEGYRERLKELRKWAEDASGAGAIEFRVYTLIDGVPLDLVRSAGWKEM